MNPNCYNKSPTNITGSFDIHSLFAFAHPKMAANMTHHHSWSTRLAFVTAILVAAGSCSHSMVEGLRVGNPSSSIGTMTNIHHESVARQERVTLPPFTTSATRRNSMVLQMANSSSSSNASREDEIRRKVSDLYYDKHLTTTTTNPAFSVLIPFIMMHCWENIACLLNRLECHMGLCYVIFFYL